MQRALRTRPEFKPSLRLLLARRPAVEPPLDFWPLSSLNLRQGGLDGQSELHRGLQARRSRSDHLAGLSACGGGGAAGDQKILALRVEEALWRAAVIARDDDQAAELGRLKSELQRATEERDIFGSKLNQPFENQRAD